MIEAGTINIIGITYKLKLYPNKFQELNDSATERDKRYSLGKEVETKALDGFCDYNSKEIHVFVDKYTAPDYFYNTLRHEICHAYLYEIGYSHHDDEDLIDKLSKWIPQINKIYNEGIHVINDVTNKKESRRKKHSA